MPKVLVTGGAGYIGSHTCVELLNNGYDVVVLDNLSNSCEEALRRVEKITGKKLSFYKCDLCDKEASQKVFEENKDIDSVIHFAGLKAVGESCEKPLLYYRVNIVGTLNLLELMSAYHVNNIIFSSSATVYGDTKLVPIKETQPLGAQSPYGKTKQYIEGILEDWQKAVKEASVCLLRYFNPVGAHESGLIGEDPVGTPMNLMPVVSRVGSRCLGGDKSARVKVFGNDYDTPDGTGVRDYIHVMDLARGHIAAMLKFGQPGCHIYNLGNGRGYSVLEMIKAMSKTIGFDIPYEIAPRRPGDVTISLADPTKAKAELNWVATAPLEKMCEDLWKWQSMNPRGYEEEKK